MKGKQEKIIDVLSRRHLDSPRNYIKRLSPKEKNISYQIFEASTTNFIQDEKSNLIIAVSDRGLRQKDKSLLEELANKRGASKIYWVSDNNIVESTYQGENTVHQISYDDLFSELVDLPNDIESRLVDIADLKNAHNFDLYQSRKAKVLHDPEEDLPVGHSVDLTKFFRLWGNAMNTVSNPILLVGERGSGKTWEVLKFCQDQLERHKNSRWEFGPAFLFKAWDLRNYVRKPSSVRSPIVQYLQRRYPGLSLSNNSSLFDSLLASSHTIFCFDSFDEWELQADDEEVQQHMSVLLNMLSQSSRFLIAGRRSHFPSTYDLLKMKTWWGSTVGDDFIVLKLAPFSEQKSYIDSIRNRTGSADGTDSETVASWMEEVRSRLLEPQNGIERALKASSKYPHFFSFFRERIERNLPFTSREKFEDLIFSGDAFRQLINKKILRFNLDQGRTQPTYYKSSGEKIEFGEEERSSICQDIAWQLAERSRDKFQISKISERIRRYYGITGDVLERDLRSQTVFEIADSNNDESSVSGPEDDDKDLQDGNALRFLLRFENPSSERVTETSATGAYFVARYLAERLTEQHPFGKFSLRHKLRYLGRVRLGEVAASILKDLLDDSNGTRFLKTENIISYLRDLVSNGNEGDPYELYSPWYRHLMPNLSDMNILSDQDAKDLNPWHDEEVNKILSPPERLDNYPMVLVTHNDDPFLIGVHEVTNKQFERFVMSTKETLSPNEKTNKVWSVGSMTKAASGRETQSPPSPYYMYSNEYHLYHWTKVEKNGDAKFVPPSNLENHPVTYVSWYVAAAFCNWLSQGEESERGERYHLPKDRRSEDFEKYDPVRSDVSDGFRLPTQNEWEISARGGHDDVNYPWEVFPYYLDKAKRSAISSVNKQISSLDELDEREDYIESEYGIDNINELKEYIKRQNIARSILVESSGDTSEVMYDEFNDYGLSGLVGNVKEWCETKSDDSHSEKDEREILGASSFLDEDSFHVKYSTSLFPENTNPDVGFRVARSLTGREKDELNKRLDDITDKISSM